MTMTNMQMYLKFAMRIICRVLGGNEYGRIGIPSQENIDLFSAAIRRRHPLLCDVWCTADGLKLTIDQAPTFISQSRYYNGWKCDHFITSVIVFCPDGTIPITYYAAPGVLHDSEIATLGSIYTKLSKVFERTGKKCVVDSAFCGVNQPFIIKSAQEYLAGEDMLELQRLRQATSMRQAAEWGMQMFQASFPRVKDRFSYEEDGERKIIMKSLFLTYNFRARLVGINQIKTHYMAYLNANANTRFVRPRQIG